jgi:hypothetical protein
VSCFPQDSEIPKIRNYPLVIQFRAPFCGSLLNILFRAALVQSSFGMQISSNSVQQPVDSRSCTQAARLTEEQVGIQGYINSQPGFRGTLKYRFSDFIVHEVDLNKNIIRLTDTSPKSAANQIQPPTQDSNDALPNENRLKELADIVGDELAKSIVELEVESKESPAVSKNVVLEPEPDKKKRTAIHQFIKAHFPTLSTDAIKVGDSGQTAIRIFCGSNSGSSFEDREGRGNKRQRGADAIYQGRSRPPSDMKFLKFVLLKENYDTMSAVSTIARMLRVPTSTFAYAGTKVTFYTCADPCSTRLALSPLHRIPPDSGRHASSSRVAGRTSGRARCRRSRRTSSTRAGWPGSAGSSVAWRWGITSTVGAHARATLSTIGREDRESSMYLFLCGDIVLDKMDRECGASHSLRLALAIAEGAVGAGPVMRAKKVVSALHGGASCPCVCGARI